MFFVGDTRCHRSLSSSATSVTNSTLIVLPPETLRANNHRSTQIDNWCIHIRRASPFRQGNGCSICCVSPFEIRFWNIPSPILATNGSGAPVVHVRAYPKTNNKVKHECGLSLQQIKICSFPTTPPTIALTPSRNQQTNWTNK